MPEMPMRETVMPIDATEVLRSQPSVFESPKHSTYQEISEIYTSDFDTACIELMQLNVQRKRAEKALLKVTQQYDASFKRLACMKASSTQQELIQMLGLENKCDRCNKIE